MTCLCHTSTAVSGGVWGWFWNIFQGQLFYRVGELHLILAPNGVPTIEERKRLCYQMRF